MGRELRRKQAKREGKTLEREELIEKNPIKKLIIITIIIIIIIAIIYLATSLFVTKELNWFSKDNEETVENNVANSILAKATFNQSEETYYVYFYDFKDEEKNVTSIIDSKLASSKVYRVDTSSSLNTKYVGEKSNKNAKTLSNLKVVAPTLIKITNGKITEYYEGLEITDKL